MLKILNLIRLNSIYTEGLTDGIYYVTVGDLFLLQNQTVPCHFKKQATIKRGSNFRGKDNAPDDVVSVRGIRSRWKKQHDKGRFKFATLVDNLFDVSSYLGKVRGRIRRPITRCGFSFRDLLSAFYFYWPFSLDGLRFVYSQRAKRWQVQQGSYSVDACLHRRALKN